MKKCSNKVLYTLALSALLHLFVLLIPWGSIPFLSPNISKKDEKKYVEVSLVDKVPERLKKFSKVKAKKRQIVNSEESNLKIRPKEARFLGALDQQVKKEVIARKIDPFSKAAKGKKDKSKKKKQSKKLKNQKK